MKYMLLIYSDPSKMRSVAGPDWSPEMNESWADLLMRLSWFVENSDQTAPATS